MHFEDANLIQLLLFALTFFAIALAMFFRKIPALLALPLMAFLIPFIAGVSLDDILQYVIGAGATRLANAYTVALFGSMLSVHLQKTGVAADFIKKGAELSGDNPWTIAVMMMIIITLLFTTLGGLGAIIMIATVVMPIMSSVGIGAMTIVGIFLFGISIGGLLNAGNWALYIDVMGLTLDEIRPFALTMFALALVGALVYITVQLYRDGQDLDLRRIAVVSAVIASIFLGILLGYPYLPESTQMAISQAGNFFFEAMRILIGIGMLLLFAFSAYRRLWQRRTADKVLWTAYFTPLIPLMLILLFDTNFIAAFICGLIYGYVATWKKGSLNTLVGAMFEGGTVVMPAIILMLGIGMLLNAIIGPGGSWNAAHPEGWPVLTIMKPVMAAIVPETSWGYILLFGLAAPLALYRGPLNVWGMGYGLAAIFLASGMQAGAVMGVMLAVGQVQGISDPTNTHNVWLANEMGQDVQKVLWNTLPYTWILAILGLIVAAVRFMGG